MYVSGLRAEAAELIERERRLRPFASIEDFVRRTQLRKSELDVLAEIGALNSLGEGLHRRAALWQIEKAWRPKGPLLEEEEEVSGVGGQVSGGDGLRRHRSAAQHPPADTQRPTPDTFAHSDTQHLTPDTCPLAPMTPIERLDADYRGSGMTTGPHPMRYLREPLDAMGVLRNAELENIPHGRRVRVAGAVITRQRPGTAKGVVFITLEDETGVANLILWPDFFQENRAVVLSEPFLLAEGVVQKQDGVIHVKVEHLRPAGKLALELESHDFH
jgi:error-prone DNA polymerase